MSTLESRLDAILADPLRAAREQGHGIGYLGADIALDVLAASGRPVCQLPCRADRPTPQADRWLESSFPGWARSVLQDWHDGLFDCLDCVVFSRGDDASQRLYYYLCELQRRGVLAGPVPLIFDIALIPRESSLQRTVDSVVRLAMQLDVPVASLPDGIAHMNRQRELFLRLQASRQGPGSLYAKIARASGHADLTAVLTGEVMPAAAPRRLLLAGSVPPDERLHQAVDATGAAFVAEAHAGGLTRLGAPIVGSEDSALAIARALTRASIGPRSFIDRAAFLRDALAAARAEGVVIWLTREDEAMAWHVPAQRALLAQARIPALMLTERSWDARDGALEEMAAFARAVQA